MLVTLALLMFAEPSNLCQYTQTNTMESINLEETTEPKYGFVFKAVNLLVAFLSVRILIRFIILYLNKIIK